MHCKWRVTQEADQFCNLNGPSLSNDACFHIFCCLWVLVFYSAIMRCYEDDYGYKETLNIQLAHE
jgi:hypothetical protein